MANGKPINHPGPMLAHGINWNNLDPDRLYAVQPKFDGLRCMAFWQGDRVVLMSRGKKEFLHVEHIREEVESFLPKGWILDGELYTHGVAFQTIMSWVKREQDKNLEIEYHVYDLVPDDRNAIYRERLKALRGLMDMHKCRICVKEAQTWIFSSPHVMRTHHASLLGQGYEGSIIRDLRTPYEFDRRSHGLLKFKSWQDAEFEIVGVRPGLGKFEGCGIFICKADDREFDVVMNAPLDELKGYLANPGEYIGRQLTVKFFELTNDGIPRFPRGLRFREEE